MRILVIGQAAFGQDVFNRLRAAGEDVVAVAAPAQSLSGRPDRLRAAADAEGITAVETSKLRDPQVQARLREASPDLGVMVYVSDLIPVEVLELPKHGSIQYHPSLLPKHRGRSSINWAIIQGDKKTGVTIFWPDAGWDTGPVLMQREVEIGPDDTTGSLYYDKLYPLGIEMILESVRLVAEGKAPKIPQDESQATYEKPCEDPLVRIDWRRPAQSVYDLIRGCDPSPGAWTRHDGAKVRLTEARLLPAAAAPPGVVVSVSDEGVLVAGNGGSVLARKLAAATGPALPAAEFAKANGIAPGSRFLNPKLRK
jgi:methionyl-tRNA formyltransferase